MRRGKGRGGGGGRGRSRGRGGRGGGRGRGGHRGRNAGPGRKKKCDSSDNGLNPVRDALRLAAEAKARTAEDEAKHKAMSRRQRAKTKKAEQRSKMRREQREELLDEVLDVLREDFSRVGFEEGDEYGVSALAESCGMASFAAAARPPRGSKRRSRKKSGRGTKARPICQYYQLGKWWVSRGYILYSTVR